ncbi:hypothetical protein QVD17_22200 [Tagetes erecta]|uniref:Uncharacterized protein n=1 Tax=Tagetes erecta TaxID=13708 RepID=A0AAD8NTH8_TARER|nr:hypothetical protein QVD17_22200 [Tagetes erecta]
MTTEETPLPLTTTSPLDKPLHLLTEDDISQVTREQCRQYLKQKGMRRPSWNKSQAIQQVIMLKALLESSSDGQRYFTPRQQETLTTHVQHGTSADAEVFVTADERVLVLRNGIDQTVLPGDNGFVSLG